MRRKHTVLNGWFANSLSLQCTKLKHKRGRNHGAVRVYGPEWTAIWLEAGHSAVSIFFALTVCKATCTRIRFQKDPFSKRSVLGCPHVSYVNPETPFTRTRIDPRKRASTWKARPLCSTCMLTEKDSPRSQIALFCLFLCLPVSFFCIASRACARPEKGVYVVCESWRQVVKETLQRQK